MNVKIYTIDYCLRLFMTCFPQIQKITINNPNITVLKIDALTIGEFHIKQFDRSILTNE